jgi:hypothetical protein
MLFKQKNGSNIEWGMPPINLALSDFDNIVVAKNKCSISVTNYCQIFLAANKSNQTDPKKAPYAKSFFSLICL